VVKDERALRVRIKRNPSMRVESPTHSYYKMRVLRRNRDHLIQPQQGCVM
jgi:hypothetical protein